MDKTVTPPSRLPDLDFLRAVAVFLVLGRHVLLIPDNLSDGVSWFLRTWNRCGWIGVDLFFTLSGFLVSGLLFREFFETQKVSSIRFLIRRGLKIYPAFYTFLLISVPFSLALDLYARSELRAFAYAFPYPTVQRIMSESLFVQNYYGYLWGHTWSLAIEEHFYLGLTVLVVWLCRSRQDPCNTFLYVPLIVVCVGLVLLVTRVHLGYGLNWSWWQILPKTHLRIDSLLYGVLLSYYYHARQQETIAFFRRYTWWLGGASIIMIAPAFVVALEDGPFMYTFGFTLLYLAFGNVIMLMRVWESPVRDNFMYRMRAVIALGRHSYSIYLWHLPVYFWVIALSPGPMDGRYFFGEVISYLGISVAIGTGMSVLVEQPVLRLRDKLLPSRSSL